MAVLVANVTFVAYVTPPGGNQPYWGDCLYKTFVAFVFFNGMAFLGSVATVAIVVVVPWLYPSTKAERVAGANKWIAWGLGTLVASFLMFTVAFVLAGLVTGGFKAPPPTCGVLKCKDGGVACKPNGPTGSMALFLPMNGVNGECFRVTQVASGRFLKNNYRGPFVWYKNNTINGSKVDGDGVQFDLDGCFLTVEQIHSTDAIKIYTSNTNKVLCMAGPLPPDDSDPKAAAKVNLEDALLNLTTNLWRVSWPKPGTTSYFMQIHYARGSPCNASVRTGTPGCLCSDHMALRPDDLTFVTYVDPRQPFFPVVHLAKIAGQQDDSHVDMRYSGDLDSKHIENVFGQKMTLYSPAVFLRKHVAVYDELQFRCSNAFNATQPTLCHYSSTAKGSAMKWYKPVAESEGEFHRMCGKQPKNVTSSDINTHACDGVAVDTDGKPILMSKLVESGSELVWNPKVFDENTATTILIFLIAICVYVVIAVIVAFAYYGWPLPFSKKGDPVGNNQV